MKLKGLIKAHQRQAEGETEAQLPFELCAVMGVIVRMAALIAIRSYVKAGGKSSDLNHLIVDKLRAPSDGGWLEVAQRLLKDLGGDGATPVVKMLTDAFKSKPQLTPEIKA